MILKEKSENPFFIVSRSDTGGIKVETINNNEEMKKKCNWVQEYFNDLQRVIREIRTAEKDCYAKIKDIFAYCSADYHPRDPETRKFFSTAQNKLLRAVTGQTAAEIISNRANADKPHMGIRTWRNGPARRIRKEDAYIAKNYLSAGEVHEMEQLTSLFLDFALEQLKNLEPLTLADWNEKLEIFLQQQGREVVPEEEDQNISIVEIVETEYETFYHEEMSQKQHCQC